MNTEENNTQFTQSSVSDSASRFIENFFEDGNFYTDLEDFMYRIFDGEEDQIKELDDDTVFNCKGSKLEPILSLSAEWITERIDDDRFSENNSDEEYEKTTKILNANIDYEKINALIPKLYYEDYRDKFTITKQDLLNALY
jgi:hypothetical protein